MIRRLSLLALLVCLALPSGAQRPERPAFKGFELYSWQTPDSGWTFVLLPGTNRNKALDEVLSAPPYRGLEALKERLGNLAVGEQVFWFQGGAPLAYPDQSVVEELVRYCQSVGVTLNRP